MHTQRGYCLLVEGVFDQSLCLVRWDTLDRRPSQAVIVRTMHGAMGLV
jgi:hypothetical protein